MIVSNKEKYIILLLCAELTKHSSQLHGIWQSFSGHWQRCHLRLKPSWHRIFGIWSRLQWDSMYLVQEGCSPCLWWSPFLHICAPLASWVRRIFLVPTAWESVYQLLSLNNLKAFQELLLLKSSHVETNKKRKGIPRASTSTSLKCS